MIKRLLTWFFACYAVVASGQLDTDVDFKRRVYSAEYQVGLMFHTRGYGVVFKRFWYTDGFNKRGLGIDLLNIRHPKEVKIFSFDQGARGYVYGRLNSFFNMRVGYIGEWVAVDKTDRGTVAINLYYQAGLSLGIVKPIYLEVFQQGPDNRTIQVVERYDPAIHDYNNIYGQASFFTGIGNSTIRPGVHLKAGSSFDYNITDERVTTLDIGAVIDFFPPMGGETTIPIMYNTTNYAYFVQVYCAITFGGRWN
jgi:hypothetical protein